MKIKNLLFVALLTSLVSCGGDSDSGSNGNSGGGSSQPQNVLAGKTYSASETGPGVGKINEDHSELDKFKKAIASSALAKGEVTETTNSKDVTISLYDTFDYSLTFSDETNCTFKKKTSAHLVQYSTTEHFYSFHFREDPYSVGSYPYIESLSYTEYRYNDYVFTLFPNFVYSFTYYTDVTKKNEMDKVDEGRGFTYEMTYKKDGNNLTMTNKKDGAIYKAEISGDMIRMTVNKNTYILKLK